MICTAQIFNDDAPIMDDEINHHEAHEREVRNA
jgi:hypothetical protein